MFYLAQAVTSLSLLHAGFICKPVRVLFLVYRVTLWQISSQYFAFPLSMSFHQRSVPIPSSITDAVYS